ncbi:hypothetical protein D3C86_2146360 [compost metagenome]
MGNSIVIVNSPFDAGGDHHATGFATDFCLRDNLLMEMLHDNVCFGVQRKLIALDKGAEAFLSLFLIEHWIFSDNLC